MRAVLQRVKEASVSVDEDIIGSINKGIMVLLGVSKNDTKEDAQKMLNKIIQLRIFEDDNNKTNLSLKDVAGQLLVISQFTLYADCHKGNRPSFINAGNPKLANELYEYFIELAKEQNLVVESGSFGADMKVSLCNDGPFTIVLECVDGKIL